MKITKKAIKAASEMKDATIDKIEQELSSCDCDMSDRYDILYCLKKKGYRQSDAAKIADRIIKKNGVVESATGTAGMPATPEGVFEKSQDPHTDIVFASKDHYDDNDVYMLMGYVPGDGETGMEGDYFYNYCKFFADSYEDAKNELETCKKKYPEIYDDDMYIDEYNDYFDDPEEDPYVNLDAWFQAAKQNLYEYKDWMGDEEPPFASTRTSRTKIIASQAECSGGDKKNYWYFYCGPEYPQNKYESIAEFARNHIPSLRDAETEDIVYDHIYWGTDEGGYHGFYNGDTFVLYDDINKLDDDMRKDAERARKNAANMNYKAKWRRDHAPIKSAEEIEKDENDLDETEQEFSSKGTAINGKQGKLPAIFKMITIPQGSLVLDFGGGDEAADAVAQAYLDQFDATELLYDKFNQTPEHNREVVKTCRSNGGADIAVCSNVLNVIKEPEVRLNVLENIKKLTKPGGNVYITVYEGSGKGEGAATQKNASYQNNKKTEGYLEEVQQVFPDATRKGKLIKATNSESVSSAIDITASEELDTCVEEIRQAARKFFQEPHIGFPENEIDDYLFIDTKENEYDPDYITIEVRAELSYDACIELADVLDTIVTKYDPDAYFDMEAPGIMVCAIPKSTVNASIQASIYDPPGMYRGPEPDDVMYADPDVAEINVYIDGDVEVAEDGSWVWLDDDWARPYDNEDMWYSEDGTPLQDYNDVIENIDLLIMQYIPGIAGKYHIKGDATLVYDIDDIAIEPGDEFGDATYYYEEATADYNSRESSIENIEVEEIVKLV